MSPDELVYLGVLAASIPVGFLFRYLSEYFAKVQAQVRDIRCFVAACFTWSKTIFSATVYFQSGNCQNSRLLCVHMQMFGKAATTAAKSPCGYVDSKCVHPKGLSHSCKP